MIEEEVVEQLGGAAVVDPHDVADCEDLLEAYYMQASPMRRP